MKRKKKAKDVPTVKKSKKKMIKLIYNGTETKYL